MRGPCSGSALLLVLFFVDGARPAGNDWEQFLQGERLAEKLRLLVPERLLESRGRLNGSSCIGDLLEYERAIGRREKWALQMLDASSGVPAGLLQGHVIDMGMYDECLGIRATFLTGRKIQARHCTYSISPSLIGQSFPINPTLSICLPASCTKADVAGLVDGAIGAAKKLKELGVSLVSVSCASPKDVAVGGDVIATALLAYIGFLVLCTCCDLAMRKFGPTDSTTMALLVRFSLLKNSEAILSSKVREDDVPVIHGIRVLSNLWVMLVHEYFLHLFAVNVNVVDIPKWYSSWSAVFPIVGIFSVDTFFTLSGFLVAYRFFKQIQKKNRFNLILYYLHRFIRLAPPVAVLLIINAAFISKHFSGARFEWLRSIFSTGCETKWWSLLLFVQNFVEQNNYCFLHLWSLAVDMQLFWISPFILYPLYKKPRIGFTILAILFLISVIASAFIVGINNYSAIYFTHRPSIPTILKSFHDVYEMPYTRASPWLLGIFFGYEAIQKNVKPTKLMLNIGWLLAFASLAFCIFGTKSFTYVSYEYSPMWEIVFAAVARPLWSLAICWIIFASIHNPSGMISSILSWKTFLPLSRISYSIYVIHIVFPVLKIGTSRAPLYFTNFNIIHTFIGNIALAIINGFFFSLMFEIPLLIFEDIIFKRRSKFSQETKKID